MNTRSNPDVADGAESDINRALRGAEDMLAQAASATGEKAAELRGRALEQLKALRERLNEAQALALKQGKAAVHATDDYVHDHPWRSILAAASAGVVIGLLIGRR
jgi:ElaB/YqjD/DUF883 family membrane-anchored ribosome-binding protein